MKEWCLEVWGDYACFTRPEMKVERVSYDVMTPSAARSIFEAILWKPAIRWHVTRIEVLSPIQWVSVRRNEVGRTFVGPTQAQLNGTSGEPMGMFIEEQRQQRAGLFLRDVRYRIHAWFEFIAIETRQTRPSERAESYADDEERIEATRSDESEAKYAAIFARRARKGQCFHRPYLGTREFACNFRLVEDGVNTVPSIDKSVDLGWMLYDMDYTDPESPRPLFFRAALNAGVLNTDRRDPAVEVRG
jgi:CRISPR-associated protein Cas5d